MPTVACGCVFWRQRQVQNPQDQTRCTGVQQFVASDRVSTRVSDLGPGIEGLGNLYIRLLIRMISSVYTLRAPVVDPVTAPADGAWRARKKNCLSTVSKSLPPNCRGTPLSSRSLQTLDLCREKFSSRLTQSTPPWQAWRREGEGKGRTFQ